MTATPPDTTPPPAAAPAAAPLALPLITPHAMHQLLADVAARLIAAGTVATSPTNYFSAFDAYRAKVAADAKPLILQSIADQAEEFDDLVNETANLVDLAGLILKIVDRAATLAAPLLLAM